MRFALAIVMTVVGAGHAIAQAPPTATAALATHPIACIA
jgi:hypothetical protein